MYGDASSPHHVEAIHDDPPTKEQLFLSDPHIQDIFHQFRSKQPLGFMPPSPRVANIKSQPLANPPPPLK